MPAVILSLLHRLKNRSACTVVACQRCEEGSAQYRVKTDLLEMLVCDECADLARDLGLPVDGSAPDLPDAG